MAVFDDNEIDRMNGEELVSLDQINAGKYEKRFIMTIGEFSAITGIRAVIPREGYVI
ncbi:MAG: hypothetical protein ACI4D3_02860 [Lachnospiraceae bacterium]